MGNIYGNQGIITQGQIGNNYIIQEKPPTIELIDSTGPTKNQDGSVSSELRFRIVSRSPANSLIVAVAKADLVP